MCCLNSGQGTAVLCSWVSDLQFLYYSVCCTSLIMYFVVAQRSLLCFQSYFYSDSSEHCF